MKKVMHRLLGRLDLAVQMLCILLLGVVIVGVMWQVLARYVTRDSTAWTAELASYAFVWLAMLAIALGVRRGRHMVLDIWEYVRYRRWLARLIPNVDVEGSALERHHPVAPAAADGATSTGPLDETADEASTTGRHRA